MTDYLFHNRRQFLRDLGLGTAALPFLTGLSSLRAESTGNETGTKRLVVFFSPNGTLPDEFWPEEMGGDVELKFKSMLSALEPYREQTLMLVKSCALCAASSCVKWTT